ncbi:MAG: hypothetical protein HFF10_05555 [Angelakisella sp.]|jgi:hypothetical protein|nr:hypothetical protein [Angelakisella sp.]
MVRKQIPISELPFNFDGYEATYGSIYYALQECPGVYYIEPRATPNRLSYRAEYFVVTEEFPEISEKIRNDGIPLQTTPPILLYNCEDYFNQGKAILEYKVHRYLLSLGLPLPEGVSLREDKVRGMEICPEFFGEFPVPTKTPWGDVLQHDILWNGLFWLKTEQVGWVFAIAYPFCDDLSDEVNNLAQTINYGEEQDLESICRYHFYIYQVSCLPVFELLRFASETWESKIDIAALKNTILNFYPSYAILKRLVSSTSNAGYVFYDFPED